MMKNSSTAADGNILELEDLVQHFPGPHRSTIKAVEGISLTVGRGETVGIVGESGSGKTTVGRTALRLYKPTSGKIIFEGEDVTHQSSAALGRHLRRRSAMIFQNPTTSLNPYMRLSEVLTEPLEIHKIGNTASRRIRVAQMFEQVGLDPDWGSRFPRELSGGQRQRVGVARALMLEPSLVVADEPTAALDVSVQAQVVNLMADLQAAHGLSYVFISHDLSLVRHISHRVAVMYLGRIVEMGTAEEVFVDPKHPYTVSLASMKLEPGQKIIPRGEIPSPANPPSGCVYHTRCPIAVGLCAEKVPPLVTGPTGRMAACHFAGELSLPAHGGVMLDIVHPLHAGSATAPAPATPAAAAAPSTALHRAPSGA